MSVKKADRFTYDMFVEAFKRVNANHGAAGVDKVTIEAYKKSLKVNLNSLRIRMESGAYVPLPVKGIEIPKKSGGVRLLGIPTVDDRIAQTVTCMILEPFLEEIFLSDSYGYRHNKSALDAVEVTRSRCLKYDWVFVFDIKGLFDNIDHQILMDMVSTHTQRKWMIQYIEKWLKAPIKMQNGTVKAHISGTSQGGVISPVLANLYMHYAFDRWISKSYPDLPWARYADDAVIHCKTKTEALQMFALLAQRLQSYKLSLAKEKSLIVYCKDSTRTCSFGITSFDFLGYTFKSRSVKGGLGKELQRFLPGISDSAIEEMNETVKTWEMKLASGHTEDLDPIRCNSIMRGWKNYYCKSESSEIQQILTRAARALSKHANMKGNYEKTRIRKL